MWFGRENDENVVQLEIDVVGLPPLERESLFYAECA